MNKRIVTAMPRSGRDIHYKIIYNHNVFPNSRNQQDRMFSDAILEQLHTLRDFIRFGASQMNENGLCFGHGTDNAIDEAAALVLQSLHLPPDLHREFLQAHLTIEEKRRILQLLQKRIQERKPLSYLFNQAWFMGLPFYVDERVLIPRSPLAELIERRFAPWLDNPDKIEAILDIGTGSGCIGIACAYAFPHAHVDVTDISADAITVTRINIAKHGLAERVQAWQTDLFAALQHRSYDLIISNPPYVSHTEMTQLPAEYQHEPKIGLVAGESGLDIVVQILREAADYLSDDGLLVVEVGNTQEVLSDTFPEVPFIWLEFERGGDGVFLLTAQQLRDYRMLFLSYSS